MNGIRNPRVVAEERGEVLEGTVAVLEGVAVAVLVVVVGEVVVMVLGGGNERGGIGVALHRRRGGACAQGGRVPQLRHDPTQLPIRILNRLFYLSLSGLCSTEY